MRHGPILHAWKGVVDVAPQVISVPGWKDLKIEALVFDFNGTLATDGKLSDRTREALRELGSMYEVHILTSDTFGSVEEECCGLPVQVHRLASAHHAQEKRDFIESRFKGGVAAIGNGANDELMLEAADLGIVVISPEGCSPRALAKADIAVASIEHVFELFRKPKRIVATLRR